MKKNEDKNLDPSAKNEEKIIEKSLRPQSLREFIGQEKVKQQLD